MTIGRGDLASLVSQAFLVEASLGQAFIEVEEAEGVVTLKGMIGSEKGRINAEALVLEQKGVKQVINNLVVSLTQDESLPYSL